MIDAGRAARLFTRSDGGFRFARWAGPVTPAVLGAEGDLRAGIAQAHRLTGRALGDAALPDLLVLVCRDWSELDLPPLARLVAGLGPILDMLEETGANQFRSFAFGDTGAIRFCAVFLKLDDDLGRVDARTLMLSQTVQSLLLWSDTAFLAESPVARADTGPIVRPDLAALLRAAYAPELPHASVDPALAARLAARAEALLA